VIRKRSADLGKPGRGVAKATLLAKHTGGECQGRLCLLGRVYLDAMTLQNPDPHVACGLIAVDEENGFALKNRLATKWWWAIHTPPLKRSAIGLDSPPAGCASQGNRKEEIVGYPVCGGVCKPRSPYQESIICGHSESIRCDSVHTPKSKLGMAGSARSSSRY
jgi:hypothetical protein